MSAETSEKARAKARPARKTGPRRKKRRVCNFCADRRTFVPDYKRVRTLREYMDERGRIRKARQTGTCRKHQRKLSRAIKLARQMALMPYTMD